LCNSNVETLLKADMSGEAPLTCVCCFKMPSSFPEVSTEGSTILYG